METKITLRQWGGMGRVTTNVGIAQVRFVVEKLVPLFFGSDLEDPYEKVWVIQNHWCYGNFELPVYEMRLPSGVVVVFRGYSADWLISVEVPRSIALNFVDLANPHSAVCYYGFPKQRVYGPYAKNRSRFTVKLKDECEVYMFLRLLRFAQKAES